VVDQNGAPLGGAKVNLEVFAGYMTSPTNGEMRRERISLDTDTNGDFRLTNTEGHSVEVLSIDEPGYELSKKVDRLYPYSAAANIFHPDPNNPAIFRLWKKTGKESLVGSAWHGKVVCDGSPKQFDLLSGKLAADGSLQITCTRTPLNYERVSRQPYDYKFEIAISGGGIQPTMDEFTYLAPDGGYSPTLTIERKAGDSNWVAWVKQEFYVKTAEGHYGWLSVEWDAGHRPSPTPLRWNCSINQSGSRNLER